MSKTILVLADGLTYEAAGQNLGYPEHLVEQYGYGKAPILGQLPSSSRPIYETLLTGLPVSRHGVANNFLARRSNQTCVFDLCRSHGLSAAASAYFWISELYTEAPFDHVRDCIRLHHDGIIEHGIYYFEDHYPDSHVFVNGEYLRREFDPDFIMIHSMNIDEAGHRYGSASLEYNTAVAKLNVILSNFLPLWLELGYGVIITGDHGMNEFGLHGGNSDLQRLVPLYLFSNGIRLKTETELVSQLAIAPLLCGLLGISPSGQMESLHGMGVSLVEA